MRRLALDASEVPRYYRIKAIDADGATIGESIAVALETEIDAVADRVRTALHDNGFPNATVTHRPA
jgi:hypothetical protein